jgi:heptosyltransferase III
VKILVIQLTRLGDILCTLPALKALRRENPDCEIHLMVRKRFAFSAEGSSYVDHLWTFDTKKILENCITGDGSITDAITILGGLISRLRTEKFDKIINLSFSTSSSYISHLISQDRVPGAGYTRTSDLFLHIPDSTSRYFRAQAGLDGNNHVHLYDLLSWVSGVRLTTGDQCLIDMVEKSKKSGIVCHVSASRVDKSWPPSSWVRLLEKISKNFDEKIILIGSADDGNLCETICSQVESKKIENMAGKIRFQDLFSLVGRSKLFIGADSAPLHIANLSKCLTLNLSVGDVRFWETGPTTVGSRVLRSIKPEHLMSDTVFQHVQDLLNGENKSSDFAECVSEHDVRYRIQGNLDSKKDWWPLVEWMYFEGYKPEFKDELVTALKQMCEVCEIALNQLCLFEKKPDKKEIVGILDRLDQILDVFRINISPLKPLLEEFKVHKENIPPAGRSEVIFQTRICYEHLARSAIQLLAASKTNEKGRDHERYSMA